LKAGRYGLPFLSKGSHKIVSACSLPLGLPSTVIDSMNMKFGTQLRSEIVQLLNRAETIRPHSYSTGSDAVSVGSREMPNGGSANKPECDVITVCCMFCLNFFPDLPILITA